MEARSSHGDRFQGGGGAPILPGVRVGRGAFVDAGAVITRNAPANLLAVGVPTRFVPTPESLRGPNPPRSARGAWRPGPLGAFTAKEQAGY